MALRDFMNPKDDGCLYRHDCEIYLSEPSDNCDGKGNYIPARDCSIFWERQQQDSKKVIERLKKKSP